MSGLRPKKTRPITRTSIVLVGAAATTMLPFSHEQADAAPSNQETVSSPPEPQSSADTVGHTNDALISELAHAVNPRNSLVAGYIDMVLEHAELASEDREKLEIARFVAIDAFRNVIAVCRTVDGDRRRIATTTGITRLTWASPGATSGR